MRVSRSALLLLLAFAAVLTAPGAASAALPWASCKPAGYQCSKMAVQLDRSGAVAGSITLDLKRKPAAAPAKVAVVALAGGPGQAAVPFASDFAQIFAATLADKDLLVFNQRGTGNSGTINCPAFKRTSGSLVAIVRQCSRQLGAKRAFYTTAQSVEDLEAIRVAGGYDQLVIYGVSYGTKVALAYAAAHPAAVQSLVLDSVVTPEGPDALRRSTTAAVGRVVADDLCEGGACAAASANPVGDLQGFASSLDRRTIRGSVYSGSGKRYTARLGTNGLLSVLLAGDLNPALRAELPGAVSAAKAGDRAPILRLSARAAGLENDSALRSPTGFQSSAGSEAALYYATICEEITTFPWTRGAPVSQRADEAEAAVKALPAGTFGIFSSAIALSGLPSSCLGWEVASPAPAPAGPLPNVPVLVIDGAADLRTPLEDAQNVAARFPQAQVVSVPDTGHSVITSELGTCARSALAAFLAGQPVAATCAPAANGFRPTSTPPRKLTQVPAVSGLPTKVGRTLNAVSFALGDGNRQVIGQAYADGELPGSVGGLRSGSVRVFSTRKLQFRGYEYVPGVRVTGTLRQNASSTFRITGSKAATGSITLRADGSAKGRLGGRRFDVKAKGSAASLRKPVLPSLADALAAGPRRLG